MIGTILLSCVLVILLCALGFLIWLDRWPAAYHRP